MPTTSLSDSDMTLLRHSVETFTAGCSCYAKKSRGWTWSWPP